ncbi:MAG: hypothetical protein ACE5GM_08965, partial [bacterium]
MLLINYVLIGFLTVYLFQLWFSLWLDKLNRKHLKRGKIPSVFQDVIDQGKLSEINDYTLDKSRLGQIQAIVTDLLFLAIILTGLLPFLDLYPAHNFVSGVVFFLALGTVSSLVGIPFDYYKTFVLEEKYGFNQATLKIWITDHLKEGAISVIFAFLLLSPVLWFIKKFPESWWVWGFLAVSVIQITLTVLYPVLIAPLFNRFEPLRDRFRNLPNLTLE